MIELKVGFAVNEKVTLPLVSVATVRLVEEAKNLNRLDNEVVEVTPFTEVVMTEPFSLNERLLELIRVVVDIIPFMFEVNPFADEDRLLLFMIVVELVLPLITDDISLTTDVSWLLFTNSAVVVAITPFMSVVRINELVEVEIVRVLFVMIEDVATTPLIVEVKTFPEAD